MAISRDFEPVEATSGFEPLQDSAASGWGWVYVIQRGDDGPVKIGFTRRSPEVRLRALQTGSPDQLRLLLAFLAPPEFEGEMHREYDDYRVRGEWFVLGYDLRHAIRRLRRATRDAGIEWSQHREWLACRAIGARARVTGLCDTGGAEVLR